MMEVMNSNMEITKYKPSILKEHLINNTNLSDDECKLISNNITKQVYDKFDEIVTTDVLKSLVLNSLIKRNKIDEVNDNTVLGLTVNEFEELNRNGCKDNANLSYSPSQVEKYTYDAVAKKYALEIMPKKSKEFYLKNYIHHHDLESYANKPNCLSGANKIIFKDKNGNVKFSKLDEFVNNFNYGDKYYVPSINLESGKCEWKEVLNAYCTGVNDVYDITFTKGITVRCTSDHKFIKAQSNVPNDKYYHSARDKYISLDDGFDGKRVLSNYKIDYKSNNNYYESALFGFFLGDGSFNKQNKSIRFGFRKKDKAKYLEYLCDKLGLPYTKSETKNGYVNYYFNNCKGDVWYSKSELIYNYFDKLNLKGVLEGLINSDGSIIIDNNNNIRLNYVSVNKDIIDLFNLCLLCTGLKHSFNIYNYDNPNHNVAFTSTTTGGDLKQILSNMYLRDMFYDKLKRSNNNKKEYMYNSRYSYKSHKYVGKELTYNLTIADNPNYMAGINGFMTVKNCFNIDLRFIARNGLVLDGSGDNCCVAKPAKSLKVLLNHMLQLLMGLSQVFSGGLGYVNFNTLLAPFVRGMDYKDIYQELEGFIFNCNMSLVSKGGQTIFSSIGMDLSCPKPLKDKEVVLRGGVTDGTTYKDYEAEANLIFKIICEIISKGDGKGKYFRYPNVCFNIRKGDLDNYEGNCKLLHELGANNPTIYYVNCVDEEKAIMGALSSDTPVMTKRGFKYPYELCINDEVMTYNDDGSTCWNKLYNIIEKEAPNKLFKITCDNGYSFKVTENHKLPTNDGIIKSDDLQVGMELYNYIDESFEPIDDYEAEFIGIFLADGFIRHKPRHQSNGNNIEFHIRKEWKANEIIKLCFELNYDYEFMVCKDGSYKLLVKEKELRDKLVKLYDDCLRVKRFPNEYWNDKNKLANIIKGLMFDGRINSNSFVWSCSDKELVYDVLFALSLIGCKSTIYVDNRKDWKINYMVTFGYDYNQKNTTKIKSIELIDNDDVVYDLSVLNNENYVCGLGGIHSENCRTANVCNYTGDYYNDCVNTGNFMYSTINLPLLDLETSSIKDFYDLLEECCEVVYETLVHRRQTIIDIHNNGIAPILDWRDNETGEKFYDINNTSLSIGYCGLSELLKQNDELCGIEVIEFLNKKKDEFCERDGLRWVVIGSPAESTAWKFGKYNKSKYPNTAVVNGSEGNYYLTNSHHINVAEGTIGEHIDNASVYHRLSKGGCILHIWLNEAFSNAEAFWSLNKKIINEGVQFWDYTKTFSYCNTCGFKINDDIDECPVCGGHDISKSTRITGYYLDIRTFNDGKLEENNDRNYQVL